MLATNACDQCLLRDEASNQQHTYPRTRFLILGALDSRSQVKSRGGNRFLEMTQIIVNSDATSTIGKLVHCPWPNALAHAVVDAEYSGSTHVIHLNQIKP